MNNWKKVKLGTILTESKIEAVESNADSRIRVLLNANGVIKRPLTKETKGATKYFKRSEGQFIYGKQNLHKGAFGIVPKELDGFTSSSDLPAFDVDESCLPEWLDYFLKQGDFYLSLIDIAKGAATKRIQPKALFEVEIPLPDTTQEQQEIIEGFKNKERYNELLDSEIQTQKQLIYQLKQVILQEAIQGKLTQEWREQNPNTEPASELLERIKAEKEQLIKEKKIKKEKPLPPITEEEIPFEIPENWVWCRGYYVAKYIDPQPSHRTPPVSKDGIPYVSMKDISKEGLINLKSARKVGKKILKEHRNRYQLEKEDFIFGKIGTIGNPVWLSEPFNYTLSANLILIQANREILNPKYFFYFLSSPHALLHLKDSKSEMSYPVFGMKKARLMPVILPPIEEQNAIVEKVETLMQKCKMLEQEITQSEQHANMLMQAVLKEAFEGKEVEKNKSNDDFVDNLFGDLQSYGEVAQLQQAIIAHFSKKSFKSGRGKVFHQKTSANAKHVLKADIPYVFEKNNYGEFSQQLSADLDSNPFLHKVEVANREVYEVHPKSWKTIAEIIKHPEYAEFVKSVKQLMKVYQNPLIEGNTDRVELLNTVCSVILEGKTTDFVAIRKAMANWKIDQDGNKTKAEKFKEEETRLMINLVHQLGWVDMLINK